MDHFQLATNGVGPGWTTFNMATCGYGFEVIIIPPKKENRGGTGAAKLRPYTGMDHIVIVRIKKDDKVWEAEYRTSKFFADKIPTVTAWFSGAIRLTENVSIKIQKLGINIKSIFVKGKKL